MITLYYDTRSTYFNIKNTENIFVAQVSVPATPSFKKNHVLSRRSRYHPLISRKTIEKKTVCVKSRDLFKNTVAQVPVPSLGTGTCGTSSYTMIYNMRSR